MKALVKVKPEPSAELKDVPDPKLGPDDVLVRVKAAGICGSDIHIYYWTQQAVAFKCPIPFIFGHEVSGEVIEVGKNVKEITTGDRVAVETHIPCQKCFLCYGGNMHICKNLKIFGVHTDGAFAEYAIIPSICAYKIPKNVSYKEGAVFEPLGVGIHAVTVSEIIPGDTVAVFGCGPIGLFTIAAATSSAAKVIAVGKHPYRLDLAKKVGATTSINILDEDVLQKVREITNGEGVDIVFEASGSPIAIKQAYDIAATHGKIVIIGVPPEPVATDYYGNIIRKEVRVIGCFGRLMWDTWRRTSDLIAKKKIDVDRIVTHAFPLDKFEEAFETSQSKPRKAGKVMFIL